MTSAQDCVTVVAVVDVVVQLGASSGPISFRGLESDDPRYRVMPATLVLPSMTRSTGWVRVYVTGTFTVLVVPTTIALPLLTTTWEKVRSGVAADADGTARADRAKAPETAAPMANLRMDSPHSKRPPGRGAPEQGPAVGATVDAHRMWPKYGGPVKES